MLILPRPRPVLLQLCSKRLVPSPGGMLQAARNFSGRIRLLFHGSGNCGRNRRDAIYCCADMFDRVGGFLRCDLYFADLLAYLAARPRGLAGEGFNFGSNDRKAPAGFSSPRRFDRRVQS